LRSAPSSGGRPLSGLRATAALAVVGLAGLPALAQEPVTDEALREQLQTRDAVIIELQRRLEQLERRLEAEGLLTAEPEPMEAEAAPVTPRPQEGLVVDELAAERALERTLVEEGALLLPAGQAELNPTVSYLRRDVKVPFAAGGQVFESRVRRDEFQFGLSAAVGLPLDSQLELFLPYEVVKQQVTARGNGVPLDSEDDWGNSVGDVSIGLAKTLVREDGGWLPDIVVRGIYDSDTGEQNDGNVPLGDGFNELRGQITLLKRQDPLAFVGAFTYSYTCENDDIQPGQQFALSLGANLALSPQTSLSVTLNQAWTDEVEIDGSRIDGSDQLASTFDFGGSAIIAPRTLLRVVSSIGLTDDAPDYGLRASVSYRFNLPFF
jgi:hypothetical protein